MWRDMKLKIDKRFVLISELRKVNSLNFESYLYFGLFFIQTFLGENYRICSLKLNPCLQEMFCGINFIILSFRKASQ